MIRSHAQLAEIAETRRTRPLSRDVEQRGLGRSAQHSRLGKGRLRNQDGERESGTKRIRHRVKGEY